MVAHGFFLPLKMGVLGAQQRYYAIYEHYYMRLQSCGQHTKDPNRLRPQHKER